MPSPPGLPFSAMPSLCSVPPSAVQGVVGGAGSQRETLQRRSTTRTFAGPKVPHVSFVLRVCQTQPFLEASGKRKYPHILQDPRWTVCTLFDLSLLG